MVSSEFDLVKLSDLDDRTVPCSKVHLEVPEPTSYLELGYAEFVFVRY